MASGGTETQVGTGATYVVAAGDVGSTLKVESSFTDDGGTEETVESAVTAAVEAAPLPTVSVERVASPVEEGEDAQFRVKRTVVTAGALMVRYGVSETGAMVASDEEGAQSVAFADGDTERTVTVPTEEDTGHEADSTVTVTLTADAAYDLGTASAEVTVEDDDNAAPTGAVTIDDTTPLVGETLTADASSLDDSDGLTSRSFTWQWVRVSGGTETEIPGATTASYTVAAADVGSTLKVEVSFTDDDGTDETVESEGTAAVEDNDDSPTTGTVTVTGTATEGETLTADTSGLTDADGLDNAAWAYQWVRTPAGGSDTDIAGATSQTYVLVYADAGATLKVRVTVTDDEGHQATLTSAPTAAVAGLPRSEVTVVSDGDVTEGSPAVFTLTRTGDLAGTLDVAYAVTATGDFGVTPFSGTATFLANSATVQVTVATTGDDTHEAHGSVTVTLTADTGADPAYLLGAPSTATAAVRDDDDSPASGEVTVTTATTFTEGETLTADTSGLTDGDGLDNAAWAYQWVRTPAGGSDADISGATSQTYVPVFADAGATLKVKVTLTDDEGHQATLTSAPTAAVAPLPRPSVTVVSDGDVTEGSPAVFTLTRTGDLARTLDVAYEVTATGDFGAATGARTATFLANDATVQVSVATTDDGAHEAHGSVTVTLTADTGADPAYLLGAPSTATAAVRDDDDSPATGSVMVTTATTFTEGETLTADISSVTDGDGLDNATWAYQWVRTPAGGSDADISDATGATYVPVFADVGATLKVRVTVIDDEGHQTTFTSAPTSAVAALPRPSVTAASDGDVTEGSPTLFTLTRTGDLAEELDVAYEVAATGDFGAATGAGTATFLADSSTVQVSVATTGDSTHEAHGSVTVTLTADTGADPAYVLGAPSTATAAVEDDDDSPATGSVTVTTATTFIEGETLTADTSGLTDADGLANAGYAYQWVRTPSGGSDADISGATGATYVPVFADVGATLKVKVTVTDDEGHEATFESAATATVEATARPSVTVVSDGDVTEGSPTLFTLTRTSATAQTLDVAYEVTASGDFGAATGAGTATFLADSSTVQVSVATTGDSTHEAHGSVTVTLTADTSTDPAYVLGAPSTATAAVRDDDDAPATGLVTVTGTATEGETLTTDTSGVIDGDGLADADYAYQWVRTPAGGSDADIPGATSQTYVPVFADAGATLKVRVTVTDDEGHEATFTSAPTSAVAALSRPSVTAASDGDVTEGETVTFTLMRTGDTAGTLDVAYTVTASGDFGAATGAGTATFLANDATVQVSVDTTGDSAHEAHGSVTVTLTADTGADPAYLFGAPSTATAAVEDDDNSPASGSVTIMGTPTEGETLSADTSGLTDGDGLADADYTYQWVRTPAGGSDADISGATSQTYVPVFADAGATLKVRVTVTDDEGHEATFTSAPTSAVAALSRPSVTAASDGDVTEGETVTFTLMRTGDTAGTLDVAYTVTASGDFGAATGAGTATFLANDATVQVSVDTTGDSAHEAHGSVTVTLTADTGADPAYLLGAPSTATAAVEDDDNSPASGSVTITGTPTEGETLTADTSGIADTDGLDNAAWVYQWVRTPSGGSDEDISGATSQTYVLVFADAGATLKVRVTVTDDEGHEATFTSTPTSAVAAAPRPSVTVVSDGDATEGSPAVFTLTRTGDLAGTLDVAYTVTVTGDFGVTTSASTATFLADSSTVQVSVATTGDSTHEAHGSVTVTLTADTGADPAYVLGAPSTATAAVEDDDDSPATGSVTVTTATTFTEGETLSADTSGLTDGDGLDNATWAYQWVRTPAGGSDADISGATGATYVPVFADAGATLKVRVTVTDDEGHQATFTSAPTSAVAALSRPSVTVVSDGDATEGSAAVFTLTRTGDLAQTLDVAYTVTATGDFGVTSFSGTATFPANSSTVRVSVATTGDSTHEAHGSVTVTLTADAGADPAYLLGDPATATAAVRDDDDSPATGSVTVTTATTFTEGETLTADTSGLADADGLNNVAWAYQWVRTPAGGSDTDIAGATSQTYVLVYADVGATLKVRVTVTDDEGHQATLTSAPTSAVATASRPSVTVVSDGDATEGSPALFTLTRTGDLAETLDVAYTVTATRDFGVTPFSGTATFLANSATVQVSVTTTGDDTHEAHGSVTVTLTADTGADPAYVLGAPSMATAAVRDDDDSPTTGAVTVTGTATEGETLSADTSGLTDGDGLDNATYVYQWVRTPAGGSDADISGVTGATYVPVYADAGATLKVKVTVTDDEGHQATFTSAPTSAVAALPRPSVTAASDGDVTEGSPTLFTLTRTGDTAQTLDVAYEVAATGDFGVTTGAGTAMFLANDATVQVSVATTGDSTHEAHGSVTVTLTADTGADPAYLLGDPATATAAVEDDDDSPATGSVTVTGTATEGETLTTDTSGVIDADGLADADYAYQWVRTPAGGSDADISGATSQTYVPVFADAGATLKVRVTVTDDEGHEATFESAATATVEATPRPSVTVVSDGDATEGSPALFTLTRTGGLAQTLDVAYEVAATGDFGVTTSASTATFLANSATVQVSVATTGDGAHEAHGSVTLTLTADTGTDPAYLLGAPSTATATVRDDDDSPTTGTVTVTGTATEGETLTADTSSLTDADGLNNAAWAYQWVRTPAGGSDADISDATGATYVPVFADVDATLKVKVTVTDDEGHQASFTSAPTSAVTALPRPSVTVVSDGDVTEGSAAVFTLTRTGATAQTLDVAYEVTASGDFGAATGAGTATFPANSATVQVSVATTGDSTHEAHGSVTVTLTADTGVDPAYVLGDPSTATAAVRDDDNAAPTGAPTIDDTTPVVGETLTTNPSDIDDADGLTGATFTWRWLRVASGGAETEVGTGATYVVVAGDVGSTLKVEASFTDDGGAEETVESAATAAVEAAPLPRVSVERVSSSVEEGAGAQFRVTRTGVTAGALTVSCRVSETGAMVASGDEGAKSVVIGDGTTEVIVTVPTEEDAVHEADSTVTLTLMADAAYELGTASAEVTVEDDDATPTVTLVLPPSSVAEDGGVSTVTATLDRTSSAATTVTVSASPVPPAVASDYTLSASRVLTIAAGATESEELVTITAVDNDEVLDRRVTVSGTAMNDHEVTGPRDVTLTIADDDGRELSIDDADVAEGGSGDSATLEFTVTLTPAATVEVTVDWASADGTATAGTDYTAGSGSLTFGAGETSRTVSVPVTGNDVDEPDKTFTVELSNASGAVLGEATGIGTITDDDDAPTVTLVLTPASITEGGGTSTVTATLNHPSSEATTVTVSAAPVSPAVAGDYTLSGSQLTVAAGATTSTGAVTVAGVDNDVEGPDKRVTVSGTATNGQGVTAPRDVTLTIVDDESVDERHRRLEYTLASFGRTVAQDLVTALEDREWLASAGTTATLAGTRLAPDSFRPEELVFGTLRRHVGPDGELAGTAALRELLSRSSFQLSLGEEGAGEASGPRAGSLVLWGRGSRSWSRGRLDEAAATRGEMLSGQVGLEYRLREDMLLGVMVNASDGELDFDEALATEVEAELVGVHPYARWSPGQGLRGWAMLGYGVGEATLADRFSALTGTDIETDIEMVMAAAGGSHEVASRWGFDWSVGTNGFLVQLDADEREGLPAAVRSEVWQVRLLLEGRAGRELDGGAGLSGNVELAARVDGGDAETGLGMELGGGVAYGHLDLGIDVRASGRVLLSHEDGLEDAGMSLALEVDPGERGRGLYFTLAPSWGNTTSGARAMWEDRQASTGVPHGSDGRRFDPTMWLDSELGYTAPLPTRRGTLTSYGAFSSDGGTDRQYRIGRRLELADLLSMSLEAERRESAGAVPEHGIRLRGSIRY